MENQTPSRPQSILILDSDYDLACILASFLSMQKFKVAQSKKAREALFKMRNQNFDMVLVDPSIRDERQFFSGLADFSLAKKKPELIILTQDLNYRLPKTLPLNLKGVLPKPFDLDSFWNTIAS